MKNFSTKFKVDGINWIKWIMGLLIFAYISFDFGELFQEIHFGKAIHILRNMTISETFLFAFLGLLAVAFISMYDFIWFYFNPRNINEKMIFRIAFIASAVNNVAGMGGIGGAMIRMFFYRRAKIEKYDLLKINILLIPSFFTGLGVLLIFDIFINHIFNKKSSIFFSLYGILLMFLVYLLIYIFIGFLSSEKAKLRLREVGIFGNMKLKISMIVASTLDWLSAGTFIWFIARKFGIHLNFYETIFFFSIASTIGIMTPVPAGIGIFDILMIFGFYNLGIDATESLGVLMIYRVFYYVIPFIVAIFLTFYELSNDEHRTVKPNRLVPIFKVLETRISLNENQRGFIKDITATLLWLMLLIASFAMILSAITPSLATRIEKIETIFSISLLQFSQSTALVLGIFLLLLSEELRLRAKRAYRISMIFLLSGALFTLLKGLNVEEAAIILAITLIILYTKDYFYRLYIPFSWIRLIKQMLIAQTLIMIYVLSGQTTFFSFNKIHKGIELLYLTPKDYFNNGITLSIFVHVSIIAWYLFCHYLLRNSPPWIFQTKSMIFKELDDFLIKNKGKISTHFIYCGDKYIYKSKDDKTLFTFRAFGNKLIVLGDPIGKSEYLVENLEEFRLYADLYGYIPVYYQVEEENLTKYHEVGYTFFKLGEEASIDLLSFDLADKSCKGFRNTRNRFEREGYIFRISHAPHDLELLKELERISNEWLNGRKEKGYSLGRFDTDYLNRAPISVLYSPDGKAIAFTSLVPVYNEQSLSIDLMRFSSNTPNSTMDFLFIMIILWAKEQGYTKFHMGMAPLSNVGESKYARKEEKIAHMLFSSKRINYNFKGLRNYKKKFHPTWNPKYLAYPIQMRVEPALVQISIMIGATHKEILKP